MADYKQLCTELAGILAQYVSLPDDPEAVALLRRARAALLEPTTEQPMTPTSAGFDGAKGIRMAHPSLPDGGTLRLKHGSKPPSSCTDADFKQQLLWYTPDGEPAQLLWCNENDEWFELSFTPIQQP